MYEHHTPWSHGLTAARRAAWQPDGAASLFAPCHAAEHAGDAPELTTTDLRSAAPEELEHLGGPPNHSPLHTPLHAPLHAPLTGGRPPWGRR